MNTTAKGKPEGSDVNDLFDAIGGPVASSIRDAAAQRLGFKGKPEEEAGWFKAQVTAGKILAKDFDQGMANFLKANQDILAKQMKSIDASQTRADNQKYLNEVGLNSDIELTQAVQDNIKAHQELNAAMQPLYATFKDFDIGLTKLSTFLLRMTAGKNIDGSDKTEQQKVQERMTTQDLPVDTAMVGGHDYTNVDGNTQHQGGPIGNFWNWLLGIQPPNVPRDSEAPKVDLEDMTNKLLPIIRNAPPIMSASDVAQMQSRAGQNAMSRLNADGTPATQTPSTVNEDNSVHNTTNVASPNFQITITPPVGASPDVYGMEFKKGVEKVIEDMFSKIQTAEVH